jgi:hypothetical protein
MFYEIDTRGQCYKTFYSRNVQFFTFLVLHSVVGSRPYLQNTSLGWKGLPGTNALAYYENL